MTQKQQQRAAVKLCSLINVRFEDLRWVYTSSVDGDVPSQGLPAESAPARMLALIVAVRPEHGSLQ